MYYEWGLDNSVNKENLHTPVSCVNMKATEKVNQITSVPRKASSARCQYDKRI